MNKIKDFLRRRIQHPKNSSLLYQARRLRKDICRIGIWQKLKERISQLYIPTPISFLIIFILLGIGFLSSHFLAPLLFRKISPVFEYFKISSLLHFKNGFPDLLAVHAGIGTIIFALIIFIAESLRDDKKYRARVLLKESFLFR